MLTEIGLKYFENFAISKLRIVQTDGQNSKLIGVFIKLNTLKIVLLKSSKKYFYPFSLINDSCTSPKKNVIGFKKALKCNS